MVAEIGRVNPTPRGMRRLIDPALLADPYAAANFIGNVLEASTETSIIGTDLDGNIQLWNEGARRLYGYEPEEVIGKANSTTLHTAEDGAAGLAQQMMATAVETGKFEGSVVRRRKNGTTFPARVVVTPRRNNEGDAIGFLFISRDVSDEVRLAQALEVTQVYTRSLMESNADAIMTTDPLGIITDVNEQMVLLTDHSREELIGSRFNRYFTEPKRADEGIRLVLREGKVNNYELTARSKTGRETLVSYNATAFFDRDRKLQGVFAAARDITEQKQLEEQLREQQNYLRGLIESSVDGLVTVDSKGLISDLNEQMCRLTGYAREDLLGTAFATYFAEPERATAGVKETFDQGSVKDYVLTLLTRIGKRLQVSVNASIFRDHVGNVRGIFASARDITDQAVLQAQFLSERAYNRGLIEASFDGLVVIDPMLTITDVNEKMCQMSGFERTELIGSAFQDYFTDVKRAAAGVRNTLDKGALTNYELTLRTKDGHEQLVSFNAATFTDQAGKVRGIFASARDITEQGSLQKLLAEEQAYNRGLFEASRDGLVTVNEDMRITDVNETLCKMVGRTRAQLVGSMFPEYFTERDRAIDGVHLTFEKGLVTNYVLTMQAANGQKLSVSFNAAVFRDAGGVVRGIFASFRDVTDQQELELQLRDTQVYTTVADRVERRRHHDDRPARGDHGRERADGGAHRPHPGGADRVAVQDLFHRARSGRGSHPAGAPRGQGHQLRADSSLQGRSRNGRQLQRERVLRPRQPPPGRVRGGTHHHRAAEARRAAQGAAGLSPRPDRIVWGRSDHARSRWLHLRRQRADVQDVRLRAGRPHRHTVRRLLHRAGRRAHRRDADLRERRRHRVRPDHGLAHAPPSAGDLQRLGVQGFGRHRARHLRLRARRHRSRPPRGADA